eukprot:COSAG06_NODE_517_length_14783_cov_54.650027_7_plen_88_part_00
MLFGSRNINDTQPKSSCSNTTRRHMRPRQIIHSSSCRPAWSCRLSVIIRSSLLVLYGSGPVGTCYYVRTVVLLDPSPHGIYRYPSNC